MSEEEAIKILNKYKNQIKDRELFEFSFVDMQRAINTILNLYKQEKEKNKELEEKNFYLPGWVSKNKIREKIEEINNRRIKEGECELALHGFQREAKIDILKELLKEGETNND